MTLSTRPLLCALFIGAASLGLTACGSSDDDNGSASTPVVQTETIKGIAATGNPFVGQVEVVNAKGEKSTLVTIAADGSFTVTVPKGAPYLLKAFNDSQTLYSYAASVSSTGQVNINQLTTAALYNANGQMALDDLYTEWAAESKSVTKANIEQAAAVVVANLRSELSAAGLSESTINSLNVFDYAFTPTAGNAFDGVLDEVTFSYTCSVMACTSSYSVAGQSLTWNYDIDTSGINFDLGNIGGGEIPTGSYSLKITTTINGFSNSTVTPNAIKPANQSEFCGNTDLLNTSGLTITQCSFDGSIGRIQGAVSGISYSYLFEYMAA